MMNYALYGAGRQSLHMEEVIKRIHPDWNARWMIENKDFSKIGECIPVTGDGEGELQVITIEHFAKLYQRGECNACLVPSGYHIFDLNYIRDTLEEHGIKEYDVFTVPVNYLRMPLNCVNQETPVVHLSKLVQICHLDIHVTNHCNMNCEACSHFSPLAYDKWMISSKRFEENINRLCNKISNICSIAILGGEPLLNPELPQILDSVRKAYRYADIALLTNAILIKSISNELVDSIKRNSILVSVSLYPPLFDMSEWLVSFFREKEIPFRILKIEKFERKLFEKPFIDGTEMTKNCGHIMCLRDNRIGRCAEALFTDYYNKAYSKNLPVDYGIDIYGQEDGYELITKLSEPLELCDQCCARDHYYQKWKKMEGKGNPSDWMIPLDIR